MGDNARSQESDTFRKVGSSVHVISVSMNFSTVVDHNKSCHVTGVPYSYCPREGRSLWHVSLMDRCSLTRSGSQYSCCVSGIR